jgi:uncharacterized protein (DUF2062 family)
MALVAAAVGILLFYAAVNIMVSWSEQKRTGEDDWR